MQLILTKEKGYSAGHTNLTRSCGFGTLYFKELADHFHSVRFKLLFALLVLSSLVALITAKNAASEAAASSEYRFLLLFLLPVWLWDLTLSIANAIKEP